LIRMVQQRWCKAMASEVPNNGLIDKYNSSIIK
jgi:hypothetical protein